MSSSNKRALFVLTSHSDLGGVRKTGFYINEAAHPWKVFSQAGIAIDLVSVRGGVPPQDGRVEGDILQEEFLGASEVARQLADTRALADVDGATYDVVFFAGGHGTMWDFPTSPDVSRVGREVYERGGIVAAVCHGPAALVNMMLSDGSYLVDGKRVAGFTNEEEDAVGLTDVVPFLLADTLTSRGARHISAESFTEHVVVDGRLVTGQNPQSAAGVARGVMTLITAH